MFKKSCLFKFYPTRVQWHASCFSVYIEMPFCRGLESKLCTFRHYLVLDHGNGMNAGGRIMFLFNIYRHIKVNEDIKLQN